LGLQLLEHVLALQPGTDCGSVGHAVQPPQWSGSLRVSTHEDPHIVRLAAQPLVHMKLLALALHSGVVPLQA
jgi:hypothetical protein